jgi:hypothetical protein
MSPGFGSSYRFSYHDDRSANAARILHHCELLLRAISVLGHIQYKIKPKNANRGRSFTEVPNLYLNIRKPRILDEKHPFINGKFPSLKVHHELQECARPSRISDSDINNAGYKVPDFRQAQYEE